MKEFDLDKALNGEPVVLRNGCKAIVYYKVPDGVQIEDTALHERIRKQGYSLEVVYGLVGEVDKLVIGGW